MTPEQAAVLFGVSTKTVYTWENEKELRPKIQQKITNAFRQNVSRKTLEAREDSAPYSGSDDFVHIPEVSITAGAGNRRAQGARKTDWNFGDPQFEIRNGFNCRNKFDTDGFCVGASNTHCFHKTPGRFDQYSVD